MSKPIENKKSSLGVAELQQNRDDIIPAQIENGQVPKNDSTRLSQMDASQKPPINNQN